MGDRDDGEPSLRVPEKSKGDLVQATIADCLACSGCVTSAETVLLEEEHSLKKVRDIASRSDIRIVATVSPASWADLLRHLNLSPTIESYRRITTLLQKTLSVSLVLDGNIFLNWSKVLAAEEFCEAYEKEHGDYMDQDDEDEFISLQRALTPSIAISQQEVSFLMKDGTSKSLSPRPEPTLPLLSSSCPALVCLVEKSTHPAVPHLSSVRSPMSLAGSFLSAHNVAHHHIAIMPCHDKKLEASRKDFALNGSRDVDIVITTAECYQLMLEKLGDDIAAVAMSSELATTVTEWSANLFQRNSSEPILWVDADTRVLAPEKADFTGARREDAEPLQQKVHSSGGYADFIFRYSSEKLFGFTPSENLPWVPVVEPMAKQSARMAARRKRDYYQVILYRGEDGSCNLTQGTPVLRFAVAYGMQTLQRALKPFNDRQMNNLPFDYVEAMACPSGCVNGGGQLRLTERETPSETKDRVWKTLGKLFISNRFSSRNSIPLDEFKCRTSFHVVPPLILQQGAVAGVSVKDVQW